MRKILAEQTLEANGGASLVVFVLGPSDRTSPTKRGPAPPRERGRLLRVKLLAISPDGDDFELEVSCSELSTVIGKGIHRAIAEGVTPR